MLLTSYGRIGSHIAQLTAAVLLMAERSPTHMGTYFDGTVVLLEIIGDASCNSDKNSSSSSGGLFYYARANDSAFIHDPLSFTTLHCV